MFFKIFSILYLLFYFSLYFTPAIIPLYGWQEWLAFFVVLVSCIGMICYAFKLKLIGRVFWHYYLVFFVCFEIFYMSWLGQPFLEKTNTKQLEWLNILLNIVLDVPLVFALFRLHQKWDVLKIEKQKKSE